MLPGIGKKLSVFQRYHTWTALGVTQHWVLLRQRAGVSETALEFTDSAGVTKIALR